MVQLGLQNDVVDNEEINTYDEEINPAEPVAESVAKDKSYIRNRLALAIIHIAVFTLSMAANSATNSWAHINRLGYKLAITLAIIVAVVVEGFYFTLRHGLRTVYQGSQRTAAKICYHTIQVTMALNMALMCVWIVGETPPHILTLWNHWSLAIHWTLAFIGATWVGNTDWVVASRISDLKAATDIEAIRRASSTGTTIVILAAKIRGCFESIKEAGKVLMGKKGQDAQAITPVTEEAI
jgi:hypothetical protein